MESGKLYVKPSNPCQQTLNDTDDDDYYYYNYTSTPLCLCLVHVQVQVHMLLELMIYCIDMFNNFKTRKNTYIHTDTQKLIPRQIEKKRKKHMCMREREHVCVWGGSVSMSVCTLTHKCNIWPWDVVAYSLCFGMETGNETALLFFWCVWWLYLYIAEGNMIGMAIKKMF